MLILYLFEFYVKKDLFLVCFCLSVVNVIIGIEFIFLIFFFGMFFLRVDLIFFFFF